MSIVHTYYNPVPGIPRPTKLLDLWRESWESKGWTTRILSEADAKEHPGYKMFSDRISRYPTINKAGYERACYLRHLAMVIALMASCGNVRVLCDYDVINMGWTPDDALVGPDSEIAYEEILEPTRVPCAIRANQSGFGNICDILFSYDPKGEKHVSDMTILRKTQIQATGYCVEHLNSGRPIVDDPGDGWKTAPMIHFSGFSFRKLGWTGDKADLIRRVLATL